MKMTLTAPRLAITTRRHELTSTDARYRRSDQTHPTRKSVETKLANGERTGGRRAGGFALVARHGGAGEQPASAARATGTGRAGRRGGSHVTAEQSIISLRSDALSVWCPRPTEPKQHEASRAPSGEQRLAHSVRRRPKFPTAESKPPRGQHPRYCTLLAKRNNNYPAYGEGVVPYSILWHSTNAVFDQIKICC